MISERTGKTPGDGGSDSHTQVVPAVVQVDREKENGLVKKKQDVQCCVICECSFGLLTPRQEHRVDLPSPKW